MVAVKAIARSGQDGEEVCFSCKVGVLVVAKYDSKVLGVVNELDVLPWAKIHAQVECLQVGRGRDPKPVIVVDHLQAVAEILDGLPGAVVGVIAFPKDFILPEAEGTAILVFHFDRMLIGIPALANDSSYNILADR